MHPQSSLCTPVCRRKLVEIKYSFRPHICLQLAEALCPLMFRVKGEKEVFMEVARKGRKKIDWRQMEAH